MRDARSRRGATTHQGRIIRLACLIFIALYRISFANGQDLGCEKGWASFIRPSRAQPENSTAGAPVASPTNLSQDSNPENKGKFPDLGQMMAKRKSIQRPPRAPLDPLPTFSRDSDDLPRGVLAQILMKLSLRQNLGDVAYAASNIQSIEGKLRAQWAFEDSKADVMEYLAQLNAAQRKLVEAAFAGGLAETPALYTSPTTIKLPWVLEHYPPKSPSTP